MRFFGSLGDLLGGYLAKSLRNMLHELYSMAFWAVVGLLLYGAVYVYAFGESTS